MGYPLVVLDPPLKATGCAPAPQAYRFGAGVVGAGAIHIEGGDINWNIDAACAAPPTFQTCVVELQGNWMAAQPVQPVQQHTHYHHTPYPLSDADVDRIARRIVELTKDK